MSTPKIPELPKEVWRGLFADYREYVGRLEGVDAFDFISFATAVGARIGRKVYFPYARPLYANIYAVLYGPSAISRKTTASRRGADLVCADTNVRRVNSLASGEGLIEQFTTPGAEDVEKQPPVELLVTPEEFATLLNKAKQGKGSTLLTYLTELYDCPETYSLTRVKDPLTVREPTLSFLACTTPEWLEETLGEVDIMSGFANRFAYVTGEPRGSNAFPGLPDSKLGEDIRQRLHLALVLLEQRYYRANNRSVPLDLAPLDGALKVWADFYSWFHACPWPNERVSTMVQRVPERVLKLALVYAVLEGTTEITREQIAAAVAFGRYEVTCIESLFMALTSNSMARLETRILDVVAGEPLTRRALHQKLGGKTSAQELGRALDNLERVGCLGEAQNPKNGRKPVFFLINKD